MWVVGSGSPHWGKSSQAGRSHEAPGAVQTMDDSRAWLVATASDLIGVSIMLVSEAIPENENGFTYITSLVAHALQMNVLSVMAAAQIRHNLCGLWPPGFVLAQRRNAANVFKAITAEPSGVYWCLVSITPSQNILTKREEDL